MNFNYFLKIDLCPAIMENHLNYIADRSILTTNQNVNYPRFSFTPETGIEIP